MTVSPLLVPTHLKATKNPARPLAADIHQDHAKYRTRSRYVEGAGVPNVGQPHENAGCVG
jgi:hypothetical protein